MILAKNRRLLFCFMLQLFVDINAPLRRNDGAGGMVWGRVEGMRGMIPAPLVAQALAQAGRDRGRRNI